MIKSVAVVVIMSFGKNNAKSPFSDEYSLVLIFLKFLLNFNYISVLKL